MSSADRAERSAPLDPSRLAVLALAVLGAFEIGRLFSGVLIGPWLSELLLGAREVVVVGEFDFARLGIEAAVSIVLGTLVAALIAVPVVKVLGRR